MKSLFYRYFTKTKMHGNFIKRRKLRQLHLSYLSIIFGGIVYSLAIVIKLI